MLLASLSKKHLLYYAILFLQLLCISFQLMQIRSVRISYKMMACVLFLYSRIYFDNKSNIFLLGHG